MKRFLISIVLFSLSATAQDAKRCAGMTKAGQPCKSTFIVKGTDYCRMHSPTAILCAGVKADGTGCKMVVKQAGEKCRHHKQAQPQSQPQPQGVEGGKVKQHTVIWYPHNKVGADTLRFFTVN